MACVWSMSGWGDVAALGVCGEADPANNGRLCWPALLSWGSQGGHHHLDAVASDGPIPDLCESLLLETKAKFQPRLDQDPTDRTSLPQTRMVSQQPLP